MSLRSADQMINMAIGVGIYLAAALALYAAVCAARWFSDGNHKRWLARLERERHKHPDDEGTWCG